MSLGVYLIQKDAQKSKPTTKIFIREDGATKEISEQEWRRRYPDREPVTVIPDEDDDEVYSANITHNLTTMASDAGIYGFLWRPDEIGVTTAKELIEPLQKGLKELESDPERFKVFNPENGWGSYDGLVRFVENYLNACIEYPDAEVRVSR